MKIIVVGRGVPERMHTTRMLDAASVPYAVVVHDEATAERLDVRGEVIVSGTKTLVEKRNFILGHLVPRDSWFIGMDDNVQALTKVAAEWYNCEELDVSGPPPGESWRKIYNVTVEPKLWLQMLEKTATLAESIGTPLVGVATMENPFFRGRKYGYRRFVKSKVFAMKNTGELEWKHEMCHDSHLSALCVARYGCVLVNQFLHHKSKMYEAGGLGDRAKREELGLLDQLREICDEFPGLVSMAKGKNSALRFNLTSEKSVERWRQEHGWLR